MRSIISILIIFILSSCSNNLTDIKCGAEHLLNHDNICEYSTVEGIIINANCNRSNLTVHSGEYSSLLSLKNEFTFGKKIPYQIGVSKIVINVWVNESYEHVAIVVDSKKDYKQYKKIDGFKKDEWNLLSQTIDVDSSLFPISVLIKNLKNDSAYVDDYSLQIISE